LGLASPFISASSQVFLPLKTLASKKDCPGLIAGIVVIKLPFSWMVMMISRPMNSSVRACQAVGFYQDCRVGLTAPAQAGQA